ncbi:MAG: hypothetical protein GVY32_04160 [Gammaproteobacteria bacterium]|jgi:hypothetical protein|nr:hypothetical protein [Gammaproteobacteria bacterium]
MAALRSALPEDLRDHPSIAKAEKPEDFIRQAVNAEKLVGVNPNRVLTIPEQGDTDGFRNALYKLGLPEAMDNYAIEPPKDADGNPLQGFSTDTDLAKGFLSKAHEAGVMPKQAEALYHWFAEQTQGHQKAQAEQAEQAFNQNIATLKEQWGDNYDANLGLADFAAKKLGISNKVSDAGLGHDPDVLGALAQVGKLLGEDHEVTPGGGGNPSAGYREQGMDLLRRAQETRNPQEARRLNQEAQHFFAKARGG